jgi:hypothetical protein
MSLPEVSVGIIQRAVADTLRSEFGLDVRLNPSRQNQRPPLFYVLARPTAITGRIGGYLYEPKFDVVYADNFQQSDANERCIAVASRLDELLELIRVQSGGRTYLARTFNRNWSLDTAEMHYMFDLRLRVRTAPERTPEKIRRIERLNLCAPSGNEFCAIYMKKRRSE